MGEVCWVREGEDFSVGILIAARHRGKGYCAPALKALAARAFRRQDIPALRCALPGGNTPALRGFLRAGFHNFGTAENPVMLMTREDFE